MGVRLETSPSCIAYFLPESEDCLGQLKTVSVHPAGIWAQTLCIPVAMDRNQYHRVPK